MKMQDMTMADQMAGHENARLKMKRLAVVVLNFKRNKEKTNEDQNKGGLSSGIAAYFCITRYLRSSMLLLKRRWS